MEKLSRFISGKILINVLMCLFWIWIISEKYDKLVAGETKAIAFSSLYFLMLAFTIYLLIKAIKEHRIKNQK